MKMEWEIVSKEIIKPSSPTPHDKKLHNLSLLDQIVPPFFVPMVFYYPNLDRVPKSYESVYETTQALKQSLSKTLSRFYPLAGRIRDQFSIDCNDEGVPFVVTKFHKNLTDFLRNPVLSVDRAHIPGVLNWDEPGPGSEVAMFQVNHYECGGIVIGVLFHHKLADGHSMGLFMKDWASNTRDPQALRPGPSFDFDSFFPHNPAMKRDSHVYTVVKKYFKVGKPVIRRYAFDAAAISKLRAKLAENEEGGPARPTRVEVVTAVVWKWFMAACVAVGGGENPVPLSLITHLVNMRKKADPPFPENSFGNFVWLQPATSFNNGPGRDLAQLFGKVHGGLRKVDSGFVERMAGRNGFSGYVENVKDTWKEFPEKADYVSCSSWCNFGLYGVDFGWGKPVWITKCDEDSKSEWPFLNVLWLMDTRGGDGIEAWLTLDEHYAAAFDEVKEFRDLAMINPCPLDLAGIN
ncbi:HXXXD-type acyl-transferase family protein [Striga hermonthica]|uniref:HXXXD-type acyl-transferase family protein n=1 Tax=Striga hermonthica TaxID=68872 RepID=A0A9N7NJQ6_STRHE|nr:HXXXD-type acyl-transferase family protein [Striga hermonthica]